MTDRRIVGGWIAIFAAIAIVLGSLAWFANGPLPYIGDDRGYMTPAWG